MQIAAKAKISRALHQSRNLYSRPPTVDRPSVEAARELKTVARVFHNKSNSYDSVFVFPLKIIQT